jgi:membrane protein required for colicin V production
MNILDIILSIILLLFAIGGYRQGLIIGLATLVGLFLGIWAAIHFSGYAAHFLRDVVHLHSNHIGMVSLVFTFVTVIILVFVLGKILESVIKIIALGFLNRMAGVLFGIAKGCLVISALIYFLVPMNTGGHILSMQQREKSKLYKPIAFIFPAILPVIKEEIFDLKETPSAQSVGDSTQL